MPESAVPPRRPWHLSREDRIVALVLSLVMAVVLLLTLIPYLESLPPPRLPIRIAVYVLPDSSVGSVFTLNLQTLTGLRLDETFQMFGNVCNLGPTSAHFDDVSISPPPELENLSPLPPAILPVNGTIAFQMLVMGPSAPGFYNVTVLVWLS